MRHAKVIGGAIAVGLGVGSMGVTLGCSGGSGGKGGTTSATGTTSASTGTATVTGSGTTTGSGMTTTGAGMTTSSSSTGSGVVGDSVLMHHKNPSRDGVYVEPALVKSAIATLHEDPAFQPSGLQGAEYAQPLFIDGGAGGTDLLIVATESNDVYALNAATGATVWTKNLGTPTPLSKLPCGNIDPYGVTGTPVIDFASRTLFVDGVVATGQKSTHEVFALSIDTGDVMPGWPVDMSTAAKSGNTTFNPAPQGERGALAVVNGTVYIPYGGLYGDCGTYHGWVVGISIADPTKVTAWATAAGGGGAWMPGGISTDGTNLFIATGNTFATTTWGGGDAVIELTAAAPLAMSSYFTPKNWHNLDNGDLDLGAAPVLFDLGGSTPSKLLIAFGKDGNAYLLDRTALGSVGTAIGGNAGACTATNTTNACASLHVSSNEIITAPAVYTTTSATRVAFRAAGVGCTSGAGGDLTTLVIAPGSPPSLQHSWCATAGGGAPMVTTSDGTNDAIVWMMGAGGDGHLHAFDGDTGAPVPFADAAKNIPNMRRYNAPIAAKGTIYVPADGGPVAFTL